MWIPWSPVSRTALALLLVSGWLAALFTGVVPAVAAHLLLAAAALCFPWKALRA